MQIGFFASHKLLSSCMEDLGSLCCRAGVSQRRGGAWPYALDPPRSAWAMGFQVRLMSHARAAREPQVAVRRGGSEVDIPVSPRRSPAGGMAPRALKGRKAGDRDKAGLGRLQAHTQVPAGRTSMAYKLEGSEATVPGVIVCTMAGGGAGGAQSAWGQPVEFPGVFWGIARGEASTNFPVVSASDRWGEFRERERGHGPRGGRLSGSRREGREQCRGKECLEKFSSGRQDSRPNDVGAISVDVGGIEECGQKP